MRSDVKKSATIFRQNVKQIRQWLEEESASAAKAAKPKELETKLPTKAAPPKEN
ncbi:unnamed protein product [Rhodiola kirilowii]